MSKIRKVKITECKQTISFNKTAKFIRITLIFNGFTGESYYVPDSDMPIDAAHFRTMPEYTKCLLDALANLNQGISDTDKRLDLVRVKYISSRAIKRGGDDHIDNHGWPYK